MITILGTKITVFALYGLISMQLLAIGLPIMAYKFRKVGDDMSGPVLSILLGVFGAACELFTIMWVASI